MNKLNYLWVISNIDNVKYMDYEIIPNEYNQCMFFEKYENAINYMNYINGICNKNSSPIIYNCIFQIGLTEREINLYHITYTDIHPLTGEILTF